MRETKRTKQVCVFDFDGTLVDSMSGFADIAAQVLSETHQILPSVARQKYLETSGLPFCEQIENIFPGDARNTEAVRRFEVEKKKNYLSKEFFQQVPEVLQYLREKGIKIAISSNNFQEVIETFLLEKGLSLSDPAFDLVLGWQPNFAKGKEHFEQIQKTLKISSDGILFIGDSLKDAEKAAGHQVDFIGKTGTFSREEFHKQFPKISVIDNLLQLKEIL
ncbi:MAG: HAD family hydrolase [Deltaproteobacteria bacterium]|nr:HAD family hydrolase [Deltaproteobacteria bacterium]